jgi:hypothetical protein
MNMSDALNLGCLCATLQPDLLRAELEVHPALHGLAADLGANRPHLFSASPVFVSDHEYTILERSVAALHRVSMLPAYQAAALQRSGAIAAHAFGPLGVFMGYDFHLTSDGPRLIEINTNAGGALLHAAAARSHRACCTPVGAMFGPSTALDRLDETWIEMFYAEWRSQRGDAPLRSVAIVDDAPEQQYLSPEFQLAQRLFAAHGIAAVIADPQELQWRGGLLWHPRLPTAMPVDMVYNRLTDFDLSQPAHSALHMAYGSGAAVVTPHPRAHALQADKRNLIALSDPERLAGWGADAGDVALLRGVVPRTRPVTAENADALWTERRQLFFKPAAGYGSKAAFRGDKLTRRVWGEIVAGEFVAQALVPPSERLIDVGGVPTKLKVDIRAYAYAGAIQLLAARTYAGQTTNFRTAGGGFSPVVVLPTVSREPENPGQSGAPACACPASLSATA